MCTWYLIFTPCLVTCCAGLSVRAAAVTVRVVAAVAVVRGAVVVEAAAKALVQTVACALVAVVAVVVEVVARTLPSMISLPSLPWGKQALPKSVCACNDDAHTACVRRALHLHSPLLRAFAATAAEGSCWSEPAGLPPLLPPVCFAVHFYGRSGIGAGQVEHV
jgi:hypothetical protein